MKRRFLLGYAHYDGNTYDLEDFDTLSEARAALERAQQTRRYPALYIHDRNDDERGDISETEEEEEEEEETTKSRVEFYIIEITPEGRRHFATVCSSRTFAEQMRDKLLAKFPGTNYSIEEGREP